MPDWLANLFVHPEFVIPGAALLSLPVIIHLINRMRYRRVKWAAMEFLLASQKRNRRRLLLEQLLLLLLRMLVVAAVVCLIARPLVNPEQFRLFQRHKTHHLVLVDDSGSMRDRWGDRTAFDAAKDVIRRIASEGQRKPDTQILTLLVMSDPDQPVYTRENLNPDFVTRMESALTALRPSHRALDLAGGVAAAHRLLAEQPEGARTFHLISDFREQDWADEGALAAAISAMSGERIPVNLVRTVPESHANLGITDLSGAIDVAAANVPLRLSATVKNYGDEVARDVRLAVLIDGRRLPAAEAIEALEPGREVTREFDVLFPTTGPHVARESLPADALEQDNHRYLSLELPDANPVLIIDGSPSTSEAFYLGDALAPSPGLTGFAPSIETLDYLRRRPIDRFQSIFLLNVGELPPDALEALEKYVAQGGGLAWFAGDQVRTGFYNETLYDGGEGLYPVRLGVASDLVVDETNPSPDVAFGDHPVFRIFQGDANPFLDLLRVERYFSTARDWVPADGVQVLATLRNKAPLVLEHRYGKGTVLTCLTSMGTSWNNWPLIPPMFVALQLEMAKHIARRESVLERRLVGEPIAISLDAATYTPQVEIMPPGGNRVVVTLGVKSSADAPASEGSDPARLTYEEVYRETDEPGLYTLAVKRQDAAQESRRFAYNVPESESGLKLAPSQLIRRRLGGDANVQIQEAGQVDWVRGDESNREIYDYVLILLLAFLMLEQALALKLSYHPSNAGARS